MAFVKYIHDVTKLARSAHRLLKNKLARTEKLHPKSVTQHKA